LGPAFLRYGRKRKRYCHFLFLFWRKRMPAEKLPWVPGNPFDRSVFGFRVRHGGKKGPMSKTKYAELKKKKLGPRETIMDGMVRIMPPDEEEYDRRMAAPLGTAARLARREAQAAARRVSKRRNKRKWSSLNFG
jgi:hypothetical protein